MVPPPNYINLNRTFAPVPQDAGAEESALQSYASRSNWLLGVALTWNQLLKHALVVLLGEPGSGKITNCSIRRRYPRRIVRGFTFVWMNWPQAESSST